MKRHWTRLGGTHTLCGKPVKSVKQTMRHETVTCEKCLRHIINPSLDLPSVIEEIDRSVAATFGINPTILDAQRANTEFRNSGF